MSKRQGISLPELLVGLFLAAILVVMGATSLRPASGQEQALASELVAQIRAVRQRAMSRQMTCAVVLPGSPGRSLSILEGYVFARLTRTRSWQGEYSGCQIQAANQPLPDELLSWLGQDYRQMPALVFDKEGRPYGLPWIDVLGAKAWRVAIGPEGRIESALLASPPSRESGPLASPLLPPTSGNSPPAIESIEHAPQVHPSMLRVGAQAIVPFRSNLALTVRAQDVDGDQLFVRWSSEGGTFSCPEEQPMDFEDGTWVARTHFRPHRFQVGARHTVECEVRDENGRLAEGRRARRSLVVDVGLAGTFAFWANSEEDPEGAMGFYLSSPEGHRLRRVLNRVGDYATLSPDGEKIAYGDAGEGVWVANADGSDPERLFPQAFRNASFSPNGNFLAAFRYQNGHPRQLVVARANGNEVMRQPLPPRTFPVATWDADNRHVYVQYSVNVDESDMFAVNPTGVLGGRRRELTRVRRFLARPGGEGDFLDFDWPEEVGNILFPDPQVGRIRGSDPDGILYAFIAGNPPLARTIRRWTAGGTFRTPSVSSPHQGRTLMMEGWLRTDDGEIERGIAGQDRFQGYSLWLKDEEHQRRLYLSGVIPRPCVPCWSR